jgi:hypothetical protein
MLNPKAKMTKTRAYKHRPSVADEASVLAILRSLANKTKTVQVMGACMALKPKWVDLLNEVRRTVMWGRQRQKGDKSPESHHSFADHDLIIRHLSPQTHQGAQQHAASLKKVEDRLVARIRSALGRSRAKKNPRVAGLSLPCKPIGRVTRALVWRARRDCINNLLRSKSIVFWWRRGFEPSISRVRS